MKKIILISILTMNSILASAQMGSIKGSVYDNGNGQTLIGANIIISNTLNGASTDLDGQFSLQVEEGVYDLKVSYISFETKIIEDVQVKANEVTILDDIHLKQGGLEIAEVQITATATRRSSAALNTMKKQSIAMLDGISAQKMQIAGDGTAAEAAKRVTGVTIEGGKYVYIRGLGDRYIKTTLNQIPVPGLDPDRNTLQMDIFPSSLIDNITVSKTFTADMPADFTGGLLNIETKAFPDEKIFDVSIGTSFNPNMHFNPDYLSYEGGKTDFLGFDDGTRALPSMAKGNRIPTPLTDAPAEEVAGFVRSFNPQLGAERKNSLMDYSASITLGNKIDLGKNIQNKQWLSEKNPKLGYIFSLSYKSGYKFYDDVIYGEYQRHNNPDIYEMRYSTKQEGQYGEKNVLWGSLAGLAYKTNYSELKLTAMHLQSGVSRAGKFNIENNGAAVGQSGYFAVSDNLEYNQRSMSNVLLNGTHNFKDSQWEIDWRISPTFSSSEDPDIRKTAFTYTANDTLFMAGAGGNPSRIWRSLNEVNATAKVDLSKGYDFNGDDAKLKFGFSQNYKQRDYEILFYDLQFFGSQNWDNPDPNSVLDPSNIYPNKPNSIYYQSGNSNPNPNAYESNVNNSSAYVSNEMSLFQNMKAIVGLRMEYYVQKHTGRDQSYASGDHINGKNLVNEKVLESFDLFPSLNLIYAIAEEQNLRFAYSKTIARPSFKELSFAQIIDPMTNRIFNGSLFPYSDWDGNLVETRIDNLDLRWEKFMDRGQIFSASLFYKKFDKPIELVRIPEQQTSTEFQPRNVGNANLYGVELEARKSLDFVSEKLENLSISGNFTYVRSSVDMTDKEYQARKSYERAGENIDKTRPMAGQSPYVVNLGLNYNNIMKGFQAGLFYNVKGPTLEIVGSGLIPDVYQDPFHSLNFGASKKLGKEGKTMIDVNISNILNDKDESVFQSYMADDQIFSSINPGITFSLGISHKF